MSTTATSTATTTAPAPTASTPAAPSSTSAMMTTPAAGGTPPPTAPTTESVNPGSWMVGMSDETKAFITNKGFKDAGILADSYRNLEKLQGVPQERLLKLPENFYDDKGSLTPEGRQIFERIGTPKDPKDYGIAADPATGDPKRTEGFLNLAKDIGLTKAQVQALNKYDSEYMGGLRNASKEVQAQRWQQEDSAIRKEWGAAFDQERQIANEGRIKMGMDAKEVDSLSAALGHKRTMELLNKIGKATGEGTFVQGQRPDPMRIPGDAKMKIRELSADRDFSTRLMNGDTTARAQWDRLHKEAFGGTVTM